MERLTRKDLVSYLLDRRTKLVRSVAHMNEYLADILLTAPTDIAVEHTRNVINQETDEIIKLSQFINELCEEDNAL